MTTLAVIYANESNIWDNKKHDFDFGKHFDEMCYAMPLEEAQEILESINKERCEEGIEEAYLIKIDMEEES